MNNPPTKWPRVKDLPQEQQASFNQFLEGQTRPVIEGVPDEEQDGYYPWDYDNFKRKPSQRFFD